MDLGTGSAGPCCAWRRVRDNDSQPACTPDAAQHAVSACTRVFDALRDALLFRR